MVDIGYSLELWVSSSKSIGRCDCCYNSFFI